MSNRISFLYSLTKHIFATYNLIAKVPLKISIFAVVINYLSFILDEIKCFSPCNFSCTCVTHINNFFVWKKIKLPCALNLEC